MTRRLLATYLALAAVTLAAVLVPLSVTYLSRGDSDLETDIERDAQSIASLSHGAVAGGPGAGPRARVLEDFIGRYQERTGARVVVVNRAGTVVADSDAQATRPRKPARTTEIAPALAGERAVTRGRSAALDSDVVVVAVPIAADGRVEGAVRLGLPVDGAGARNGTFWLSIALLSMTVLIAVAITGRMLARWVSRPLERLGQIATRLGRGDLASRADQEDGPPEVRTVATAFNTMADRLERVMTAQRQFVSDAAHELRTPLGVLRLRIENLAEHPLPDGARDDAEASAAEIDRLATLIEGLLELASIDAEKAPPDDLSLGEVAASRCEYRQAHADAEGVTLTIDLPPSVRARTRVGAIEQVVDNLLDNAFRAAGRGGEVRIEVRSTGEWAELRVSDSGPGMSPADRERAFDRFWRGAGSDGGSGLGLAIVKQLAAASGGEVSLVHSDLGGLGVVVALPAAPYSTSAVSTEETVAGDGPSATDGAVARSS